MGYPFDKTWSRRIDSTANVSEIIQDLPHVKLCDFKIYCHTKLYQGEVEKPHPPTDITWDNTIKDFFTPWDVSCMNSKFNLADKSSVATHAPAIYGQVKNGTMPKGEERWPQSKVEKFKMWMDADYP